MVAQDSPVYIYHSGLISSATGSVGSQKCLGLDVKLYITQTLLSTPTAAKSLQSCPTLCDPIDGSPPGSAVPEILQARTLEWVAISFSNAWNWKVKVKSLSRVQLLATPWTTAYQAPPSMGFSRQEYWSGGPLPSPLSTPNPLLIISRAQHFLSISTNSLLANAILPLVSSLINSQFLTKNPLLAPDQAVTITIKLNLTVLSMMGLTLRDLFPAHFQTLSLPFCSPSGGPPFFCSYFHAGVLFPWGFTGDDHGKEPAYQCRRYEPSIRSLACEDPLEEGMAIYSSILSRRIPRTEEPGWLLSMGSQSWPHLRRLSMAEHMLFSLSKFTSPPQLAIPCALGTYLALNM